MESVLRELLGRDLAGLVKQHGAAMALQRRVRRQRASRVVKGERERMRVKGKRKVADCVLEFLGSFALGSEPRLASWEGIGWYRRYEPDIVARLERVSVPLRREDLPLPFHDSN